MRMPASIGSLCELRSRDASATAECFLEAPSSMPVLQVYCRRVWWVRGFSRARTSVVHVILAIGVFLLEVGRHLGFEKQAQRDCRDSRPCAFLPFEQQQHIGVCHEDAEDA